MRGGCGASSQGIPALDELDESGRGMDFGVSMRGPAAGLTIVGRLPLRVSLCGSGAGGSGAGSSGCGTGAIGRRLAMSGSFLVVWTIRGSPEEISPSP